MQRMRVLLLSTYELGHQPLHLAVPAARLEADGHAVEVIDLAVEALDWQTVERADAVAVSVPMHTAMILAVDVVRRIRAHRPDLPVAFYGLYATLGIDPTVDRVVHRVISGEYVEPLSEWIAELSTGMAEPGRSVVRIGKPPTAVPQRSSLPALDRYAHLKVGDEHRLVGYVEATQGCGHTCRHCPVPAVYGGRFRAVDIESIRADVDQLVGMGARHVTFGDPDFLNGPAHAERVLVALRGDHSDLTFDVTVKVEHVLAHADIWERMAAHGVLFVVSAYESVDDRTLQLMDKGHTAADLGPATMMLRSAGIDVRPSLLPFTPWTELDHLPALFSFLSEFDLLGSIDPIQLAIRLLIPKGSLMLDLPETRESVTGYRPESLSYQWESADPRLDPLQLRLSEIAEWGADRDDHSTTLLEQWGAVVDVTASKLAMAIPTGAVAGRPRLTEPWFC